MTYICHYHTWSTLCSFCLPMMQVFETKLGLNQLLNRQSNSIFVRMWCLDLSFVICLSWKLLTHNNCFNYILHMVYCCSAINSWNLCFLFYLLFHAIYDSLSLWFRTCVGKIFWYMSYDFRYISVCNNFGYGFH